MITTIPEPALFACISYEPETATQIYRRYADLHQKKALTGALRRERRAVAVKLEQMARRGIILRSHGDAEFHPVPVYMRLPELHR